MMYKRWLLFFMVLVLSWCSLSNSKAPEHKDISILSPQEKIEIYNARKNIFLDCDALKLGEETCKALHTASMPLEQTGVKLIYGTTLKFPSFEFMNLSNGELKFKVDTWAIEVSIKSLRECSKEERNSHLFDCSNEKSMSEKSSYLTLKSGEEYVVKIDDYVNLHSDEEKAQGGRKGIDVDVQTVGWESVFDYQVSFK